MGLILLKHVNAINFSTRGTPPLKTSVYTYIQNEKKVSYTLLYIHL